MQKTDEGMILPFLFDYETHSAIEETNPFNDSYRNRIWTTVSDDEVYLTAEEGISSPEVNSSELCQKILSPEQFVENSNFAADTVSGYYEKKSSLDFKDKSLEQFTNSNDITARTLKPDIDEDDSQYRPEKLKDEILNVKDPMSRDQLMDSSLSRLFQQDQDNILTSYCSKTISPRKPTLSSHLVAMQALESDKCNKGGIVDRFGNVTVSFLSYEPEEKVSVLTLSECPQQYVTSNRTAIEEVQISEVDKNSNSSSDSDSNLDKDTQHTHCYQDKKLERGHIARRSENACQILQDINLKVPAAISISTAAASLATENDCEKLPLSDYENTPGTNNSSFPVTTTRISRNYKLQTMSNIASKSNWKFLERFVMNDNRKLNKQKLTSSSKNANLVVSIRNGETVKQLNPLHQNFSSNCTLRFPSDIDCMRKNSHYNNLNKEMDWLFEIKKKEFSKGVKPIQQKVYKNRLGLSESKAPKKTEILKDEICETKEFDYEPGLNAAAVNEESSDNDDYVSTSLREDYETDDFLENENLCMMFDFKEENELADIFDTSEDTSLEGVENLENGTTPLGEEGKDFHGSPMKFNKVTSSTLLVEAPIIFKYIDDDTQEIEEMIIYPKDYLKDIQKVSRRTLTREEMLTKLIEHSTYYDGKSIGIVTNVRNTRLSIENKSINFKICKKSASDSVERERLLRRCTTSQAKNLQIPIKDNSNVCRKWTTKLRNPDEHSTSHTRVESKKFSKPLSQSTDRSYAFKRNTIKSPQQTKMGITESLFKVPKISEAHIYKCGRRVNGAGDQLNVKSQQVKDCPIRSASSNIRFLDITPFPKRTIYTQQTSTIIEKNGKVYEGTNSSIKTTHLFKVYKHAKGSSGPITSTPRQYETRKPWVGPQQSTSRSPDILQRTMRREQLTILKEPTCCLQDKLRLAKTMTSHQALADDVPSVTLAIQRYDPSMSGTWAQRLRIALRKELSVDDIVSSDFKLYFCSYAKIGKRFKSGSTMSKANSMYWLSRAGVVCDEDSRRIAEECFAKISKRKLVLNIYDYVQFLLSLARRKKVYLYEIVDQLMSVSEPHRRVSYNDASPVDTSLWRSSAKTSPIIARPKHHHHCKIPLCKGA